MMIPSQASKAHSTNQWVEVPVPVVHGEYQSTAFGVTERRDDDEATLSNVTPRPYTRASALRIHHWQLPPRRLVTNPHRASYGLPPWSSCPVHPFVMIAMAVPIRFPPIATGQSRSTNMPVAPKKKKVDDDDRMDVPHPWYPLAYAREAATNSIISPLAPRTSTNAISFLTLPTGTVT